jgi:hypothetical protein
MGVGGGGSPLQFRLAQVWAPTTWMVLKGLTRVGAHDLAADVARNFHDATVKVFAATGTVWENLAPVRPALQVVVCGRVGWGARPPTMASHGTPCRR